MDNLFQQAKDAMNQFTNMSFQNGEASEPDKQAAQDAIQAAYENATPEEKQQLEELKQQLEENQLS